MLNEIEGSALEVAAAMDAGPAAAGIGLGAPRQRIREATVFWATGSAQLVDAPAVRVVVVTREVLNTHVAPA